MEMRVPEAIRKDFHKHLPYGLRTEVLEALCIAVIEDIRARGASVVVTEIREGKWRMPDE